MSAYFNQLSNEIREDVRESETGLVCYNEQFLKRFAETVVYEHCAPFVTILTEILKIPENPSATDYERCLDEIQKICETEVSTKGEYENVEEDGQGQGSQPLDD